MGKYWKTVEKFSLRIAGELSNKFAEEKLSEEFHRNYSEELFHKLLAAFLENIFNNIFRIITEP